MDAKQIVELKSMIENAFARGVPLAWEAYVLLFCIVLLAAIAGTFLGAYLKQRGKNFATRADFEELLKQTKALTVETENIKNDLARSSWLHQQSWSLKEKYYSGLLENLWRLRDAVSRQLDYYLEPGSEYRSAEIYENKNFQKLCSIYRESIEALRLLTGPAGVVVGPETTGALEKLFNEVFFTNNIGHGNAKDDLESLYGVAESAYEMVLAEAKAELNKDEGRPSTFRTITTESKAA